MGQFKYAVNTNGFRNKLSNREIVQFCAKLGLDGIEWGLPALEKAQATIGEMDKLTSDSGLEVAGYINAGHLLKPDIIKQYSEIVASVRGKTLRLAHPWLAFNYEESLHQKESYMDLRKRCHEGLEKLIPLSRQYNIRYLIEMHMGSLCASAEAARYLVDGFDPACVGIIYDPANGIEEGFTRPRHALEVLGPYHAYTHAKNTMKYYLGHQAVGNVRRAIWEFKFCPLDCGMVDFLEVYFALKAVGYKGWISLEEIFLTSPEVEINSALMFLRECELAAPSAPQEPFTTFNQ